MKILGAKLIAPKRLLFVGKKQKLYKINVVQYKAKHLTKHIIKFTQNVL